MTGGKLAVITGASSGIGEATARLMAREGWTVVIVARSADKLEALKSQIEHDGGAAVVEVLDAADGEAVIAMSCRIRNSLGTPRVIVNSAGAGEWKFIEDTPPAEAQRMMGAPYFAAYNTTQAFMKDMLAAREGTIIHINSPVSRLAWPGATGYAAARWALRGLHDALYQDLVGTGVHSCHVVFGEVSSNYFQANPGSHDGLPSLARMLPVSTPDRCAEIIWKVVRRPRRELVYPFLLRTFYWLERPFPGLVRWAVRIGSRRH